MNAKAINILTLIAAILVGYGVVASRDNEDEPLVSQAAVLQGYYLKNAVISETSESGAPRLRLAAETVEQDLNDDAMRLRTVRGDFANANKKDAPATRWTIAADEGYVPKSKIVTLKGNVIAQTVDAPRRIVLKTSFLEVDTERQSAKTDQPIAIDVAGDLITGRGLTADLPTERLRIEGHGELHLAARPAEAESKVGLPGIFENEGAELKDGGVRLKNVRSRTAPFVQADEAIASSTDLDNNRFTLKGNVRFDLPQQGKLQADTAIVTIRQGSIVHAVATGKEGEPVQFEHQLKTQDKQTGEPKIETARGHARTIDYDVASATVYFTGDVWFSYGRYESHFEDWKYNLIDGSGSSTHRATTIINPSDGAKSPKP